tara:strand:+ start:812 stop:1093 length:282 start_codon:yes stop_codon:yes gene_type:complete
MNKKKILIGGVVIGLLWYFYNEIVFGLAALCYLIISPSSPVDSVERVPESYWEEKLSSDTITSADTILDIEWDCGGTDDPKMWIGIEGDTIWK